jgi:hypothetical protein
MNVILSEAKDLDSSVATLPQNDMSRKEVQQTYHLAEFEMKDG